MFDLSVVNLVRATDSNIADICFPLVGVKKRREQIKQAFGICKWENDAGRYRAETYILLQSWAI